MDVVSFANLMKNLCSSETQLEKVLDFVVTLCPDGQISIEAVCKYFDRSPEEILNGRKMSRF